MIEQQMTVFLCSLTWLCVFCPSGELVALTTRFTDELMSQGLTRRLLTLVSEINVTREFERLQKERGLGNEKHRKEVRKPFSEELYHEQKRFVFLPSHVRTLSFSARYRTSSKSAGRHWQIACLHGPANHLWIRMTPWPLLPTLRR